MMLYPDIHLYIFVILYMGYSCVLGCYVWVTYYLSVLGCSVWDTHVSLCYVWVTPVSNVFTSMYV